MSTNLIVEASKCRLTPCKSDREKRERLAEVRASMLPAEAAARADIDARIADLERCERGEQRGRELGLSILSPEIFHWKKDKLPAFAVFSVDGDGECILSTDQAKEKIPSCCKSFYQNVLKRPVAHRIQKFFSDHFKSIWCLSALVVEACYFFQAQANAAPTWGKFLLGLTLGVLASFCASLMCLIVVIAGWTLLVREVERTAVAKLTGVIPYRVKQRLKQFETEFKEIIIVAEGAWNLVETRKAVQMPSSCDPLMVGWDGDFFWIIDAFDTSSIEQLALDEFAVKPDSLESSVDRL